MEASLTFGILLVVIGGCMEGVYSVPLKFTPRWRWEQIWGAGSLLSLLLVGWPVALLTVPHLPEVFSEAGFRNLVAPALFGLGWGAGGIFFGLGVEIVGVAVGVSLVMGLIAIIGSILPLLLWHREQFAKPSGQMLVLALLIMLAGISLSGRAAGLRAKNNAEVSLDSSKKPFTLGLLFCVLSGLLSPMINFALLKGDFLRDIAIHHGTSPMWAENAVWALAFTMAYGLNVAYCLTLMLKNRTLIQQTASGGAHHWVMGAAMGILWAGGVVLYGVGITFMGHLGAYAGWPLLLISAITAATIGGAILGEWRSAGPKAIRAIRFSILLLMIAAGMLWWVNKISA
jgi:L-rhamnose-H+ transport protein